MKTKQSKGQEILSKITAEISKVVIGKDELKELLLVALLSEGHVLIEGLPGTAKTTLARTFAQVIGGKFKRVQGTPDMLPADILGFYLHRPDGSSTFMPGPIFANVVLADELNRTTPRTQAALIEAMQEQQVTIERETHLLEPPFIVIASQVPYGGVGTSPLSDVQIDRFMFRIWSTFPTSQEEGQILQDIDQILEADVSPVATLTNIIQLQQQVKKVHIADNIRHYIIEILNRLRHHQDLARGPSPRGGIALFKGSRALAFIQGRDFVIPDDVKRLLTTALGHRLQISAEAEMDEVAPEAIINKVVAEVPVPKGEAVSTDEEKGEAATEAPVALPTAPDEVTTIVDEVHQEAVVEEKPTTDKIEDALVQDEETGAKAEAPTGRRLTDWEWIVILCAFVVAVVMLCLGLLSIR